MIQHLLLFAVVTTTVSSKLIVGLDGLKYIEDNGCIFHIDAIRMTKHTRLNSARTSCKNLQSYEEGISYEYIHTCVHDDVHYCCQQAMSYPWSCMSDSHSKSPRVHKRKAAPGQLPPLTVAHASSRNHKSTRNNQLHHQSQTVNHLSGRRLEPILQKGTAQTRHAAPAHDHS